MVGIELILACAPGIPVETVQQIIQVESGGNPLAINVNKGSLKRPATDAIDAADLAKKYIAAGYSVDMGLMQVNSSNLASLGYTVNDMFDTCKNIKAGTQIYSNFYNRASQVYREKNQIHVAALSAYNTGDFTRGLTNGYVAKFAKFGFAAPEIAQNRATVSPVRLERIAAPINPYTASSAVFTKSVQEAPMSNTEKTSAIVSRNSEDSKTPGVQVEHTADEAERNGAFEETALSENEAWESNAQTLAANDPTGSAIMISGRTVR